MAEHDLVLFDTSVVIKPPRQLSSITRQVAVSSITVAELAAGLMQSADPIERARRHERMAFTLAHYSPIPYSSSAARLYGALCDALREIGRNPRPRRFDLLIASVAGDLGIPLLTRNPDDFRGIHEVVRVIGVGSTR